MAESRKRNRRLLIGLALAGFVFAGLALGLYGIHVSRADVDTGTPSELARQVTVFAVVATPGTKTVDSRLSTIKTQLDRLLPKHGFRLLDARSNRVVAGEPVTCNLDNGSNVVASVIRPMDENGKVELRCELFRGEDRQFSTLVSTPLNQLFFCQRELADGSQLLIGVGARNGVGAR
jgi:hypothetical protein